MGGPTLNLWSYTYNCTKPALFLIPAAFMSAHDSLVWIAGATSGILSIGPRHKAFLQETPGKNWPIPAGIFAELSGEGECWMLLLFSARMQLNAVPLHWTQLFVNKTKRYLLCVWGSHGPCVTVALSHVPLLQRRKSSEEEGLWCVISVRTFKYYL